MFYSFKALCSFLFASVMLISLTLQCKAQSSAKLLDSKIDATNASMLVSHYNIAQIGSTTTATKVLPCSTATMITAADPYIRISSDLFIVVVTQGDTQGTTININAAPLNGYTGPVAFSTIGLPSDVIAAFVSPSVTLSDTKSATSHLRFVANAKARPGDYPMYIRGNGGTDVQDDTSILLTVLPAPNKLPFKFTVTENSMNIFAGSAPIAKIVLTTAKEYSKPIVFSLADDPNNPIIDISGDSTKIYASFSQTTLTTSGASEMLVHIGNRVPKGLYHLMVIGSSSDGAVQAMPLTLSVLAQFHSSHFKPDIGFTGEETDEDTSALPVATEPEDLVRFNCAR